MTIAMSLFKFDDFRISPVTESTLLTFFFRLSFLDAAPSLRFRFFAALLGSLSLYCLAVLVIMLGFATVTGTCLSSGMVDVVIVLVKVTRPFLY